jgi:hypothetical protein
MPNAWIEHVRTYAADNNLSYACALSTPACRESYQPTPNYTPQLKRIAAILRNRGRRPPPEMIQDARAKFNELKNLINDLPQSDRKRGYMRRLVVLRDRILYLLAN